MRDEKYIQKLYSQNLKGKECLGDLDAHELNMRNIQQFSRKT